MLPLRRSHVGRVVSDLREPYCALLRAVRELGEDELRILVVLAERLRLGRERYGEWIATTDSRDYYRERSEELLDAAIYGAMAQVSRTIPAPALGGGL